jgi:hypothetical protein
MPTGDWVWLRQRTRRNYVAWLMRITAARSASNVGGFRTALAWIAIAAVVIPVLVAGLVVSEILVDAALRGGR